MTVDIHQHERMWKTLSSRYNLLIIGIRLMPEKTRRKFGRFTTPPVDFLPQRITKATKAFVLKTRLSANLRIQETCFTSWFWHGVIFYHFPPVHQVVFIHISERLIKIELLWTVANQHLCALCILKALEIQRYVKIVFHQGLKLFSVVPLSPARSCKPFSFFRSALQTTRWLLVVCSQHVWLAGPKSHWSVEVMQKSISDRCLNQRLHQADLLENASVFQKVFMMQSASLQHSWRRGLSFPFRLESPCGALLGLFGAHAMTQRPANSYTRFPLVTPMTQTRGDGGAHSLWPVRADLRGSRTI